MVIMGLVLVRHRKDSVEINVALSAQARDVHEHIRPELQRMLQTTFLMAYSS
jgi:hypothetical protein